MKNYKIAVAGTGYVGLSIATLLSQHHQVTAVDIVPEKVEMINNRKSPIQDDYIEKYLEEKELNLTATLDAKAAYSDADFVVIAAPTNYDSHTQHFDTSAVEAVIKLVMEYNPDAVMVIKSTIPVGYTASVREKFNSKNIIFSPEFLRESKALYDNLYPSRIIVGTDLNNDSFVFGHPLGSVKDVNADCPQDNGDTFFGNMGKIVSKLKTIEPNARIFVVTPQLRGEACDNDIRYIASELAKLCDMFEFTYLLDMTAHAPVYDAEMRKSFGLGFHPNPMGYYAYALIVGNYIDYIIRSNPQEFATIPFVGTLLKNKDYK